MSAALRKLLASLSQADRDAALSNRWGDGDRLAARCGIDFGEMRALLSDTRPQAPADRFKWRQAITKAAGAGRLSLKGVLVADALFQRFNPDNDYFCWPNQATIAMDIGWSASNTRGVVYGLGQLCRIGAIRRIKASDAPDHIRAKVIGRKSARGSGRDARSTTYLMVPPEEWPKGDGCIDHAPNYVHSSCTLNLKCKPVTSPRKALHSYRALLLKRLTKLKRLRTTSNGCSSDSPCTEPHAREASHG